MSFCINLRSSNHNNRLSSAAAIASTPDRLRMDKWKSSRVKENDSTKIKANIPPPVIIYSALFPDLIICRIFLDQVRLTDIKIRLDKIKDTKANVRASSGLFPEYIDSKNTKEITNNILIP